MQLLRLTSRRYAIGDVLAGQLWVEPRAAGAADGLAARLDPARGATLKRQH